MFLTAGLSKIQIFVEIFCKSLKEPSQSTPQTGWIDLSVISSLGKLFGILDFNLKVSNLPKYLSSFKVGARLDKAPTLTCGNYETFW